MKERELHMSTVVVDGVAAHLPTKVGNDVGLRLHMNVTDTIPDLGTTTTTMLILALTITHHRGVGHFLTSISSPQDAPRRIPIPLTIQPL
jgi:hypothetical protein